MPGRSIGVQWFAIDKKAHTLALDMKLPALLRPNSRLTIPIKVDGLGMFDQARVVVAAVDVGILNLTNYKPPAPDDYYLGQRQLSAELRDLYGQLIDGMQGTRGQIRTGGDGGAELTGAPPTQAPLALFSGIVDVSSGNAEVDIRHSGVRRHRPRHGGGLEQGQGRQGHRRRHRARSGGADGDVAALHAQRRQEHDEPRPRQRRGRGRRLRHQCQRRGPRRRRRGRIEEHQPQRQAARPRGGAAQRVGGRALRPSRWRSRGRATSRWSGAIR